MRLLNWIFKVLKNFEIFGMTPFRGIATIFGDSSLWATLFGFCLIAFILKALFGTNLTKFVKWIIKLILKIIKKIIKSIGSRLIDIYYIILIKNDAKRKGYLWSEYWANRTLTKTGIISTDVTGVEKITIQHPALIGKTIKIVVEGKRILKNIFLLLKKSI